MGSGALRNGPVVTTSRSPTPTMRSASATRAVASSGTEASAAATHGSGRIGACLPPLLRVSAASTAVGEPLLVAHLSEVIDVWILDSLPADLAGTSREALRLGASRRASSLCGPRWRASFAVRLPAGAAHEPAGEG